MEIKASITAKMFSNQSIIKLFKCSYACLQATWLIILEYYNFKLNLLIKGINSILRPRLAN